MNIYKVTNSQYGSPGHIYDETIAVIVSALSEENAKEIACMTTNDSVELLGISLSDKEGILLSDFRAG